MFVSFRYNFPFPIDIHQCCVESIIKAVVRYHFKYGGADDNHWQNACGIADAPQNAYTCMLQTQHNIQYYVQ